MEKEDKRTGSYRRQQRIDNIILRYGHDKDVMWLVKELDRTRENRDYVWDQMVDFAKKKNKVQRDLDLLNKSLEAPAAACKYI